jgi:hypothetical protein
MRGVSFDLGNNGVDDAQRFYSRPGRFRERLLAVDDVLWAAKSHEDGEQRELIRQHLRKVLLTLKGTKNAGKRARDRSR